MSLHALYAVEIPYGLTLSPSGEIGRHKGLSE